jgi:small subunit ribosomal protein S18
MADETRAPEQQAPAGAPGGRPGGDRPRFGGGGRGPGGGPPREGGPGGRKFFRRKKVCKFCVEKIEDINYKDYRLLGQFVAESGKIVPRRLTGVCAPHQHRLSSAIKQARNIALLPFAGRAS